MIKFIKNIWKKITKKSNKQHINRKEIVNKSDILLNKYLIKIPIYDIKNPIITIYNDKLQMIFGIPISVEKKYIELDFNNINPLSQLYHITIIGDSNE